jgi:hypothetical protein
MKKLGLLLVLSGLILVIAGCAQPEVPTPGKVQTPGEVLKPNEVTEEHEIKVTREGIKYIVEPNKVVSGGPPKDGIPSIDFPKFVTLEEADEWIQDNELVIAIVYKGVTRVYPLQIMVWHEIVNDTIAGDPLLITY